MLIPKLWLSGLMVLCFSLASISEANASKNKAKVKIETMTLKISNLSVETPPKEVRKLERAVKNVVGVKRVAVRKKKGELTVRHTKTATATAIKDAVRKAGFTMLEPKPEDDAEPEDDVEPDEDSDDAQG